MIRRCLVFRVLILSVSALSILSAWQKKETNTAPAVAPAAAPAGATVDPKSFVIGAEDVLLVRVWRDAEVSGQVVVRPDGMITLQLIGEVKAAGLTPEGLTQSIYDDLLKLKTIDKSEVTVTVLAVNSKKYFIQGEVGKPGAYPLLVPTTVLEALVHAGGFRDFANQKKIRIMRNGTIYNFNYKQVVSGKKMEQNIQLQPGDQIIVP